MTTNTTPTILSVVTLALCITGSSFLPRALAKEKGERAATLTGCVVAGEEKDSFLLTGVTVDGNVPANAFYRLDKTKDLRMHVGHRVEVSGVADLRDYDTGRMKVKTDEHGKTTTELKADGKTIKVEENIFAGSTGAMKVRTNIPTYGFEVKHVKRLEGSCAR